MNRWTTIFLTLFFLLLAHISSGQIADTLKPERITSKTIIGKYYQEFVFAEQNDFFSFNKNSYELNIKKNGKFKYTTKFVRTGKNCQLGSWKIQNDTLFCKTEKTKFHLKTKKTTNEYFMLFVFVKGDAFQIFDNSNEKIILFKQ